MAAKNPNPQPWAFAAYEAPVLTVSMTPTGSIAGQNFQLNIRRGGVLLYTTLVFAAVDLALGVFSFTVPSASTGAIGVGGCDYDVWRIDAGFERRLAWGPLDVTEEQWK